MHERTMNMEIAGHEFFSADGKLFAGDGGGPSSAAARLPDNVTLNSPGNGQWIYLFRPQMVKGSSFRDRKDLIDTGYFKAQRLVNLAKHNYSLEPNVTPL